MARGVLSECAFDLTALTRIPFLFVVIEDEEWCNKKKEGRRVASGIGRHGYNSSLRSYNKLG